MDENTIFQNPLPQQTQASSSQPQPPQEKDFSDEKPPSFLPKLGLVRILKFLLGVLVVVLVGFIIFNLVASRFGQKSANVTLSYWGLWEDPEVMVPIISDFEREYPNIKVSYSKQDISQYRERLATRIPNGTGPDIFRFHNTWVPMLSGLILPLPADIITTEEFKKSFYPVIQKDLIKNGVIYGIPHQVDTLSLFINKDLFSAAGLNPPTKWEDFMNYARQLTVKDQDGRIKTAGAAMGTFGNITHAPDIISLLFKQNGVDINDIAAKSERASEALIFYTSFAQGLGSIWDNTLEASIISFSKENLAMFFGYSRDLPIIRETNSILNFEVHPVPHLPGQDITVASYWAEGVSIKTKNKKESFLFMKFLNRNSTLQKLYAQASKKRSLGDPYPKLELANLLKDNRFLYPFVAQANNSVSSFFVDGIYDNGLNDRANAYLEKAVSSVLSGNSSSQNAVEILSQGINELLNQYGQ